MMAKFLIILHYMRVDFEYDKSIFFLYKNNKFLSNTIRRILMKDLIGDSKGNIFNDNTFESVK